MESEEAPQGVNPVPALPRTAPWSRETRRWVVAGLVLAAAALLYALREAQPPIVLALLLAYLLNPLVTFVQQRGRMPRLLAAGLVYFTLILLLIGASVELAPILFRQLGTLVSQLDQILAGMSVLVTQIPFLKLLGLRVDPTTLSDQLREELAALAAVAPRVIIGAAAGALNAVLILVLSFYLVKDAEVIERNIDNAVPTEYRNEWLRIKAEFGNIWSNFLRGQVFLAVIIGIMTSVILAVLGVPNALLLGLLAGLLEVIPTVGPIVAAIPAVLIAFFRGSQNWPIDNLTFAVIVIIAYVMIQQLENHLIVPNVLGSSVNLPPTVILIGAFAGAKLAGVLGLFLAVPVLATARLVGQFLLRKLLEPSPPNDTAAG